MGVYKMQAQVRTSQRDSGCSGNMTNNQQTGPHDNKTSLEQRKWLTK